MTIRNLYYPKCDDCGNPSDALTSIDDARELAWKNGWHTITQGYGTRARNLDFCPDCWPKHEAAVFPPPEPRVWPGCEAVVTVDAPYPHQPGGPKLVTRNCYNRKVWEWGGVKLCSFHWAEAHDMASRNIDPHDREWLQRAIPLSLERSKARAAERRLAREEKRARDEKRLERLRRKTWGDDEYERVWGNGEVAVE